MANLYNETVERIKALGYQPSDITFIGSEDGKYSCSWEEFTTLADRRYGEFGTQEVATDLLIRFRDETYLMREEYDGSEHWEHFPPFVMYVGETKPLKSLFGAWDSLECINEPL